ncbi:hypothetical protein KJ813_04670 [bacterium]|nr:hypothetical protein [bacterium]MBU4361938.1 hypothetical protein [bacterium]MBU4602447.1 hypothetical protein [bacterium]
MNKTQKLILAIFVPIIFFFIALVIANSVGVSSHSYTDSSYKHLTSIRYTNNPFDWEKTWYVWLVYSASCCLFEYLLFRDKKREIKRG